MGASATTKRNGGAAARADGFASVLAAVDLGPGDDRVRSRVALLPLGRGAKVTLLHVVPSGFTPADQRRAVADARKALAVEAADLRKQLEGDRRVETRVETGSPPKVIAAVAEEAGAELVVVGRGRGRVLHDAFVGSTAERVARQCRRPVLVARARARGPYLVPAVAVDLDRSAHEVLRVALRALPSPPPRLHVIHAVDVPYLGMTYPSLSEDEAEQQRGLRMSAAMHELAELVSRAMVEAEARGAGRPAWTPHVLQGPARAAIERALRRLEADVVVLGTRSGSTAAFMFLGSIAGDVLRAARCDVLLVPPARRRN